MIRNESTTGQLIFSAETGYTSTLGGRNWSLIVVMYRDDAMSGGTASNNVLRCSNSVAPNGETLRVRYNDNTDIIDVRVQDSTTPRATTASSGALSHAVGTWGLLGVSWNNTGGANGTGQIAAWFQPRGGTRVDFSADAAAAFSGVPDPTGLSLFGNGAGSDENYRGTIAAAMGTGLLTSTNFDTIYTAFNSSGAWGARKAYNAINAIRWDAGFVHTTGGGAKIGDAVTTTNVEGRLAAGGGQIEVHSVASTSGTLTIVAPDDIAPTGGWVRIKPGTSVDQTALLKANPVLRAMGRQETPTGVKRVLITGNSRSVGHNDSDGGDGAFSGGVEYHLIQNVLLAGTGWGMNAAGSPRRVWGDPTLEAASTGTVEDVSTNGATYSDWSRMGGGSARTGSLVGGQSYYDRGPGAGTYMVSGATFAPGAFSDAATLGLIDPAAALTFRAYYLMFPGAGTLRWQTAKGTAVDDLATLGSTADIDCDTETDTYTFNTATDTYDAATRTMVITTAVLYESGLCFHNPARTSMAQVSSIVNGGSTKTIVFKQAFKNDPQNGDVFSIGAYGVGVVDASHAADAVNVWRGMKFTAVSGDVCIMACDAWATDANGYFVSAIGWGGHGYDDQLASAFDFNAARMIAAIAPDAVMQSYVTQDTDGSHVDDYRAEIETGMPGVPVFQFGEGCHSTSGTTLANQTNTTARDNVLADAPSENVSARDFIEFATIGEYGEQLVNGEREDTAHFSARGANKIAGILLDAMALFLEGGGGAEVRPIRTVREVRAVR